MNTHFRWLGEWSLAPAILVALLLASLAWWLYFRETRTRTDRLRWMLPTLRAFTVLFLFLVLAGPVLQHRRLEGDLARLLLFGDASRSMSIADPHMPLWRKMLVARQSGWIDENAFHAGLVEARTGLLNAEPDPVALALEQDPGALRQLGAKLATNLDQALTRLEGLPSIVWKDAAKQATRWRQVLLQPVEQLAKGTDNSDIEAIRDRLKSLIRETRAARDVITGRLQEYMDELGQRDPSLVRMVQERFDGMNRGQRLEALWFDGAEPLLQRLAGTHQLESHLLTGETTASVWNPGEDASPQAPPRAFNMPFTNLFTDLSSGLRAGVEKLDERDRVAVVLFSDGRHNTGLAPAEMARILGNRGIPIFTVGLGSIESPPDLAVMDVEHPNAVFLESSVRGKIQLRDDMPPGESFQVLIAHQGKTVWSETLTTEKRSLRTLDFDFPIESIVKEALAAQDQNLKISSLPLEFEVLVPNLPGEMIVDNNRRAIRINAVTSKPKVLLMEGRPRWEFRYLRNVLDRDNSWEINTLLAGTGGQSRPWARGDQPGQFPADKETLFSYQLIVMGDLDASQLGVVEWEWIREYVEKSGGGVILIDGLRYPWIQKRDLPVGPLIPVTWEGASLRGADLKLSFQSNASGASSLQLLPDSRSNADLYAALPAPRWAAPSRALPGAEVWLKIFNSQGVSDSLVFRRYGAGRVLYLGFDELWRWRYDVGDRYYVKFWNQAAKEIMEPAYQVSDAHVSLDTGAAIYQPGERAQIRARLRDKEGRLLLKASAEALIHRDGRLVSRLPLTGDESTAGVFRAVTPPLIPGDYEIGVRISGIPESDTKARTTFLVQPTGASEMAAVACDEDLLRTLASESGGWYFREEDIAGLEERLRPLSEGKIVETETLLWQSYWWFVPLVVLLATEWALRKKAGMP